MRMIMMIIMILMMMMLSLTTITVLVIIILVTMEVMMFVYIEYLARFLGVCGEYRGRRPGLNAFQNAIFKTYQYTPS